MPVPMPVPLRGNANMRLEAKYNVITDFPSFDLHSAAAAGNMGLVEYALQRGQPINSVLDGVLPLHAACAGGNEQVVKLLIDHGADVNAPRLPRRYSNDKNRDASAPIVGTSGSTPLHFAAANGNTNIIDILLLNGARADRADKHGVTPEQLAFQNGWLECADGLRKSVATNDKNLRERQPPVVEEPLRTGRSRNGSFGFDLEPYTKRLRVKKSVDNALNMLKGSSQVMSESYNASTSSPPASPANTQSIHPPDCDTGGRRSSLTGSPGTLTPSKGFASPCRPHSADNGAEKDLQSNSPKSGNKKLTSKYSIMGLFKRNDSSAQERVDSQTSLTNSLAPSPSIASFRSQPIPISASSSPEPFGQPVSSSPSGLAHRMGSDGPPGRSLPSMSPRPSAFDLHNAMSKHHRDRSGSASSRIESGLGLIVDPPEPSTSSPPTRRPKPPSQLGHSRHRSGSANRNGAVFDDDLIVTGDGSVIKRARPSILRAHNRSSSSGQGTSLPPNLRSLRFDSTSSEESKSRSRGSPTLRPCNSANSLVRFADTPEEQRPQSPPSESGPLNVADSDDISDDEDDYGRAYEGQSQTSAARLDCVEAFSSAASQVPVDREFPFSLCEAPPSDDATTTRTSQDGRDRGDSVSSTDTNPAMSVGGSSSDSARSVTATPPLQSSVLESTQYSGPKIRSDGDCESTDDHLPAAKVVLGDIQKVPELPVDIHAQAQAQVQRAQQEILAHDDVQDEAEKLPLSARLAAYGESLARLRELQGKPNQDTDTPEQKEDAAFNHSSRNFGRQRSMDDGLSSHHRVRGPRRPHTSSGASSTDSSVSSSALRARHHVSSLSITEGPKQLPIRLPAGSLYNKSTPLHNIPRSTHDQLSRVSSVENFDTDTDPGLSLCRISTAPHLSTAQGRQEQARNAASATKLTRMGFAPSEGPAGRMPSPHHKRFGTLKSLFKGKQA